MGDGPPTVLVDEMLGRLARYLRFLGCDAEYVRGLSDAAIVGRVAASGRRLLTRDQALARRLPGRAVLLTSTELSDQLREVARALPGLARSPSFSRCTECNGLLEPVGPADEATDDRNPPAPGGERPTWRCRSCGHRYWEGSHTDRVRRDVARWLAGVAP